MCINNKVYETKINKDLGFVPKSVAAESARVALSLNRRSPSSQRLDYIGVPAWRSHGLSSSGASEERTSERGLDDLKV